MKKRLCALAACVLAGVIAAFPAAALPQFPMDYVYVEGENQSVTDNNSRIYIPVTYNATEQFSYVEDPEGFSPGFADPEDLFIAPDDTLYVADTGNSRIVALNPDGSTKAVWLQAGDSAFSMPKGVFVDKNGDIYVADSGNGRIVHMKQDGSLIKEYGKPESELLADMAVYEPSKIVVGPTGYLYTLVGNKFMSIDTNNAFKGYLGATELDFDLGRFLVETFGTQSLKDRLPKREPPSYNNLFIDSQNRFVACSAADTDQIRVINSVGRNIYKPGFYGETAGLDESNHALLPSFVDLTVDDNGIITLIEQRSGRLYQYDSEGNVLTVFSGLGDTRGYFTLPVSIAQDSSGNLYVLDKTNAVVQKFEPTDFIKLVHEASRLYLDGEYDESFAAWQDIIKINADYPLARRRLGAIYVKKEDYAAALEQYDMAGDMDGYSTAFGLNRHEEFRAYFTPAVLCGAVVLAAGVTLVYFGKRYADRLRDKAYARRGRRYR